MFSLYYTAAPVDSCIFNVPVDFAHTNCTHELQIGLIYMLLACRWERKKREPKPNSTQAKRASAKNEKNEESKREMLDLGNEKNHTAVNKWHFSASKWASCANN